MTRTCNVAITFLGQIDIEEKDVRKYFNLKDDEYISEDLWNEYLDTIDWLEEMDILSTRPYDDLELELLKGDI